MRYLLTKMLFVLLLSAGILTGCTEDEQAAMVQQAVALENGDECHLCGMIITNYPGPKGQLFSKGIEGNLKFCSTRDMFAFIADPENKHNVKQVFVHDMAISPWEHPDEETYVDAREAFFVVGHRKKGAMGATLASFSKQEDALAFADIEGGEVLRFDEIDLEVLVNMTHSH